MAASKRAPWAGGSGLPTLHVVHAALNVAALLDQRGSLIVDARETYWHRATGGSFAPADLRLGEQLLLDCGLVIERDGTLYPMPDLRAILEGTVDDAVSAITVRVVRPGSVLAVTREDLAELVPDPARREELLAALGRRFDDTLRRLIGAIGEELVVAALREELASLGYPELARDVRHVSLETDQAGYDVSAPRVVGARRLIEVKATTSPPTDAYTVHISRNEADSGARYANWCLVICRITNIDTRAGEILGWCPATRLARLVPVDVDGGRWESAVVSVRADALVPGLPGPAG